MDLTALRSRVRFYLNDATTSPNQMWDTSSLDEGINIGLTRTANLLRRHEPGWYQKTDTKSSVKDQEAYSLPTDFIRFVKEEVLYHPDGDALTNQDNLASADKLEPHNAAILQTIRDNGEPMGYVLRGQKFLLVPAPDTSGTDNILLVYAYEPPSLSTASEEPLFPANHHDLIALEAARALRAVKELPRSTYLEQSYQQAQTDLLIDLKMGKLEPPQIRSAAFDAKYENASKQGTLKGS